MAETKLTRQQYRHLTVLRDQLPEGIANTVAQDILEQAQNDPIGWLRGLLQHGCVSGWVSGMIYHWETHAFFDRHYDEIEELRQDYEACLANN